MYIAGLIKSLKSYAQFMHSSYQRAIYNSSETAYNYLTMPKIHNITTCLRASISPLNRGQFCGAVAKMLARK